MQQYPWTVKQWEYTVCSQLRVYVCVCVWRVRVHVLYIHCTTTQQLCRPNRNLLSVSIPTISLAPRAADSSHRLTVDQKQLCLISDTNGDREREKEAEEKTGEGRKKSRMIFR